MQGTKALYGMTACSHSVWCFCRGEQQHMYCAEPLSSYANMVEYIEKKVSCKMKSFEDMCMLAHYSPGAARGK
eukprot:1478786-Pleurochrysis_carterae.AAC.1